jgi:bile acid:Na+ symporter, BASS family
VARVVVTTVFAPLCAGLLVRALAQRLPRRLAGPVSAIADILLPVAALAIIYAFRKALIAGFSISAALTATAFVTVGLAVGHWLSGPDPSDRTLLAFSTASRHPGIAIAIASANFPEKTAFIAAVFLPGRQRRVVGAVSRAS